jgi:hypothetical protein
MAASAWASRRLGNMRETRAPRSFASSAVGKKRRASLSADSAPSRDRWAALFHRRHEMASLEQYRDLARYQLSPSRHILEDLDKEAQANYERWLDFEQRARRPQPARAALQRPLRALDRRRVLQRRQPTMQDPQIARLDSTRMAKREASGAGGDVSGAAFSSEACQEAIVRE